MCGGVHFLNCKSFFVKRNINRAKLISRFCKVYKTAYSDGNKSQNSENENVTIPLYATNKNLLPITCFGLVTNF